MRKPLKRTRHKRGLEEDKRGQGGEYKDNRTRDKRGQNMSIEGEYLIQSTMSFFSLQMNGLSLP